MKKTLPISSYILITVISVILLISISIGSVGIIEINSYVNSSSRELTDIVCENEAHEINSMLLGMEKSVQIMSDYVQHFLPDRITVPDASLSQEEKSAIRTSNMNLLRNLVVKAEEMFLDIAENTDGAIAYRLRFSPEITSNNYGIFWSVNKDSYINGNTEKHFHAKPVVDLSLYQKDDAENVGWYWQPKEAGEAVWMVPYENSELGITMITYVMPIYKGDTFIGVVGIDFDYHSLRYKIDEISTYERGFAFLAHHDHIAYHKDYPQRHHIPDYSEDYIEAKHELRNGTSLIVLTHKGDLSDIRNDVVWQMILIIAVMIGIFSTLTFFVVKWFTSPLVALTADIEKIAERNYDINPVPVRTREIKILSETFINMAHKVAEHDKHQHELAYRDALTGLRNSTSYTSWKSEFIEKIGKSVHSFGVAVFDINYLKDTNDKYGHDIGNKLLIATARTISYVFKRSPVFRVGGDEFIVILQDFDLEHYSEHVERLHEKAKNEPIIVGENKIPVSIAIGVALYDEAIDDGYMSVFKRADTAMYQNKKEIKANGGL